MGRFRNRGLNMFLIFTCVCVFVGVLNKFDDGQCVVFLSVFRVWQFVRLTRVLNVSFFKMKRFVGYNCAWCREVQSFCCVCYCHQVAWFVNRQCTEFLCNYRVSNLAFGHVGICQSCINGLFSIRIIVFQIQLILIYVYFVSKRSIIGKCFLKIFPS